MPDTDPTSDQLRQRIDSGRTGEKVSHPDPAAAPLGSDAEAAGAPTTKAERQMADTDSSSPFVHPPRPIGTPLFIAAIIALICVVFLVVAVA